MRQRATTCRAGALLKNSDAPIGQARPSNASLASKKKSDIFVRWSFSETSDERSFIAFPELIFEAACRGGGRQLLLRGLRAGKYSRLKVLLLQLINKTKKYY